MEIDFTNLIAASILELDLPQAVVVDLPILRRLVSFVPLDIFSSSARHFDVDVVGVGFC